MLNPRKIEEREKKKVGFLPPQPSPEPLISNSIPTPLPRSNSMGGLSSLSKSVSKQQEQVDDLTTMIDHLKEIIKKYENEIKQLQHDNKQRDVLIEKYEKRYAEIEKSISDIWNS